MAQPVRVFLKPLVDDPKFCDDLCRRPGAPRLARGKNRSQQNQRHLSCLRRTF